MRAGAKGAHRQKPIRTSVPDRRRAAQQPEQLLTQAGYARRRGVARSTVRDAVRDGRIHLEPGGKIDPVKADREWAQNTDLSKPRNSVTGTPKPKKPTSSSDTIVTIRADEAYWKARGRQLEYERKTGELVPREAAERAMEEMARRSRQRLERIPDRLAPLLAAETDPVAVHRMLREEIRLACSELAGAADFGAEGPEAS